MQQIIVFDLGDFELNPKDLHCDSVNVPTGIDRNHPFGVRVDMSPLDKTPVVIINEDTNGFSATLESVIARFPRDHYLKKLFDAGVRKILISTKLNRGVFFENFMNDASKLDFLEVLKGFDITKHKHIGAYAVSVSSTNVSSINFGAISLIQKV